MTTRLVVGALHKIQIKTTHWLRDYKEITAICWLEVQELLRYRGNKIVTSMTSLEEKLNKCKVTVTFNPCHYQYHLLLWVSDCGLRIALVSDDHQWPQSVIPFHRETKYPRDDNARSSWTDDKMWACPGYALVMSRIEFAAISPRAATELGDEAFRIADYFHLIDDSALGFS